MDKDQRELKNLVKGHGNIVTIFGVLIVSGFIIFIGYYIWQNTIGDINKPIVRFENKILN